MRAKPSLGLCTAVLGNPPPERRSSSVQISGFSVCHARSADLLFDLFIATAALQPARRLYTYGDTPMSSSDRLDGRRPQFCRRAVGSKGAVFVALAVALFMAMSSMTAAMASTALVIGGLGATTLSDNFMKLALGNKFTGIDPATGTPWKREAISWPAQAGPLLGQVSMGESVAVGTANLLNAIRTTYNATGEAITVFGMSEGSAVVDEVMRALANDPSAPPSSALKFIVAGDANQRQAGFIPHTYGGYKFQPPAQTPYNLTVVTYEYDGWSDWPDRVWNFVAARNALAGALLLHNKSYFIDLSTVQAANVTTKQNSSGGVTTYYLIPTDTLPLVLMNPRLAPREEQLKKKIDAAYSRNDAPKAGSTATALTASAATESGQQSSTSVTSQAAVAPTASANEAPVTAASETAGNTESAAAGEPAPKTDAATRREDRAETRAQAKAAAAAKREARAETRAQAKAAAAAKREARAKARTAAKESASTSDSSSGSGSSTE